MTRRHSAEVTAARLLADRERWHDRLSGQERDAIAVVRSALHRITDEDLGTDTDSTTTTGGTR